MRVSLCFFQNIRPPHVIGIWCSEILVESLCERQKLRLIAEVPLAKATGRVALALEHFGDRDLSGIESAFLARKQNLSVHLEGSRWCCDRRMAHPSLDAVDYFQFQADFNS